MLNSKQKELDGLQQNLASLQQTKSSLEQELADLVRDWFISSGGWFGCFVSYTSGNVFPPENILYRMLCKRDSRF